MVLLPFVLDEPNHESEIVRSGTWTQRRSGKICQKCAKTSGERLVLGGGRQL